VAGFVEIIAFCDFYEYPSINISESSMFSFPAGLPMIESGEYSKNILLLSVLFGYKSAPFWAEEHATDF
jgi:hypothetical protein